MVGNVSWGWFMFVEGVELVEGSRPHHFLTFWFCCINALLRTVMVNRAIVPIEIKQR